MNGFAIDCKQLSDDVFTEGAQNSSPIDFLQQNHVNCDDIRVCWLVIDVPNDNVITHEIVYESYNYLTFQGLTARFNHDLTYIAVALSRALYIFDLWEINHLKMKFAHPFRQRFLNISDFVASLI